MHCPDCPHPAPGVDIEWTQLLVTSPERTPERTHPLKRTLAPMHRAGSVLSGFMKSLKPPGPCVKPHAQGVLAPVIGAG